MVAVVGGGQLARMMQAQAVALDVHLRVLVEAADGATGQVVPDAPVGAAQDEAAVRALLPGAQVLTFEHEHVPHDLLVALEAEGVAVRPGARALRLAQDKIHMRTRLSEVGVPCPAWRAVRSTREVRDFADEACWPVVLKTARGGYDGKGVRVLRGPEDLDAATDAGATVAQWLGALAAPVGDGGADAPDALLAEAFVPFTRELSMLLARRPSGGEGGAGEIRCWPVVETVQEGGVCSVVLAPAPHLADGLQEECERIGRAVAQELGVTGVLAVELFEVPGPDGAPGVLVNELAMRPHNSGHWTIDGSVTSQFEQHLRAVLDWPLGGTAPTAPASVMVNLLGSDLTDPHAAYPEVMGRHPRAKVHLYGKEVRPGRKLGHVTVTGTDHAECRAVAGAAVALLRGQGVAPAS